MGHGCVGLFGHTYMNTHEVHHALGHIRLRSAQCVRLARKEHKNETHLCVCVCVCVTQTAHVLFTRMHVLHPPVTLLDKPPASMVVPRKQHIVMVGRFFQGRQSKGHPQAIQIFSQLYTYLPEDTKLIMVRVHTHTHKHTQTHTNTRHPRA